MVAWAYKTPRVQLHVLNVDSSNVERSKLAGNASRAADTGLWSDVSKQEAPSATTNPHVMYIKRYRATRPCDRAFPKEMDRLKALDRNICAIRRAKRRVRVKLGASMSRNVVIISAIYRLADKLTLIAAVGLAQVTNYIVGIIDYPDKVARGALSGWSVPFYAQITAKTGKRVCGLVGPLVDEKNRLKGVSRLRGLCVRN